MEKKVTLYNMIFPIWVLFLFPKFWWISLIGNLLLDFIVLFCTTKILKIDQPFRVIKKVFLKAYLFGFIADILGCIPMLAPMLFVNSNLFFVNDLLEGLYNNPFSNIYSISWCTICIFLTGVIIYIFNYKVVLTKVEVDIRQKKKIALFMAIFTAPYLFYLPAHF